MQKREQVGSRLFWETCSPLTSRGTKGHVLRVPGGGVPTIQEAEEAEAQKLLAAPLPNMPVPAWPLCRGFSQPPTFCFVHTAYTLRSHPPTSCTHAHRERESKLFFAYTPS